MVARIIGLDIGHDAIRAIELEGPEKARPVVSRAATIAVPEGAVRSGEVRELKTVASAVRKLLTSGGFRSKDIVLGMGNQRVIARDLTVPKMGIEQIREALPFQVQDMLPVPVADAILDFYPISEEVTDAGTVLNGLLVAAIKESVLANVGAVTLAGSRPVQVDLVPFALSRVLARGTWGKGTVAIIDIGASTTNVVVTSNGVPQFVRMIAGGGGEITSALSRRLEIDVDRAEAAKRARGLSSAPVTSQIEQLAAEVIFEKTGELISSLRNTISYYVNNRHEDPIQAVILTGGGSLLPGLARVLSETLRLQVVQADPFSTVDVSKSAAKSMGDTNHTMTVALGLALGSVA